MPILRCVFYIYTLLSALLHYAPSHWKQPCWSLGQSPELKCFFSLFKQNQDRKHRTYVYVLTVTEILEDWEDSVNIGRKREWFKVEDAIKVLQCHKPVHAEYLEKLKLGCSPTNGNSSVPSLPDNNALFVTAAPPSGVPSSIR